MRKDELFRYIYFSLKKLSKLCNVFVLIDLFEFEITLTPEPANIN